MSLKQSKWNSAFNLCLSIKQKYIAKHNTSASFATMAEEINPQFHSEIQIKQTGDIVTLKYRPDIVYNNLWDDVLVECRGLTFNLFTNQIINAGFPKFFNIEQHDPARIQQLFNQPNLEIAEKRDGTMVCARAMSNPFNNYPYFISLTGSHNPSTSPYISKIYQYIQNHTNIQDLIKYYGVHFSLIFEWTSPDNLIVVPYDTTQLTLLTARDIRTGHILSYADAAEIAKIFHIPTPQLYNYTYQELLNKQATLPSTKEGYVLRQDQFFTKVKGAKYVEMHRWIDEIDNLNAIIYRMAKGTIDDFVAKVPAPYQPILQKNISIITNRKKEIERHIISKVDTYKKLDLPIPKTLELIQQDKPEWSHFIIRHYLNKPYNILHATHRPYKAKELGIDQ